MVDLRATYKQLARPSTREQLAARYREADRRAEETLDDEQEVLASPVSLLAAGIPPASRFSVAIHVIHVLPPSAPGELAQQLLALSPCACSPTRRAP